MTYQVNIHEAKTHFSKLLQRVMNGEEVVIAKAGRPIARLLPYTLQTKQRIPGNDAGKIVVESNFDEPLPEFEEL
ncbi:MAG: type II toxin-antitoxin system Phd/YefM family antitoxin [Anaerolineales bacterium]|jgi:prevent-host-death family protein